MIKPAGLKINDDGQKIRKSPKTLIKVIANFPITLQVCPLKIAYIFSGSV